MVQKSNHNLNISRPGRLKKKKTKTKNKNLCQSLLGSVWLEGEMEGGKGMEGEGWRERENLLFG